MTTLRGSHMFTLARQLQGSPHLAQVFIFGQQ
jgi:hypothetical protein